MDMISPQCQGLLLARVFQEAEAHLHARFPTYLPRRPAGDQAVTRERLPGGPQVWKACTAVVCTSPRMGRASWALLRRIQD